MVIVEPVTQGDTRRMLALRYGVITSHKSNSENVRISRRDKLRLTLDKASTTMLIRMGLRAKDDAGRLSRYGRCR
jgi:hypothetical protein